MQSISGEIERSYSEDKICKGKDTSAYHQDNRKRMVGFGVVGRELFTVVITLTSDPSGLVASEVLNFSHHLYVKFKSLLCLTRKAYPVQSFNAFVESISK